MTEETLSSTHPPTPPTTEEDRFSWLRLLRSRRVGVSTFYRLLAEHGSAQNALAALPELARQSGIDGYEICPRQVIDAELKAARAAHARLLFLGSETYPAALTEIPEPPPMLWAVGQTDLGQRPGLALVGARSASSLGVRGARKLAADLGGEGYVIVSGLARGVDAAAHQAALATGTIGVLAGGVDVVYPDENRALYQQMCEHGLILSEQPMGLRPMARHFPKRNRILAGLARGVVLVEAAAKSGSLITARDALDLGREVMAVPGHPIDARAAGCNMLIRDGATLIRHAKDVIEAIGPQPEHAMAEVVPASPEASPHAYPQAAAKPASDWRRQAGLHQEILTRLGPAPLAQDQLIRDLPHPVGRVGAALTDLELDGRVTRDATGLLRRSK